MDDIERHLEPLLGPCKRVFHELVSNQVHIDVLIYPPTETRDFWTLVTAGMSDLPMNKPAKPGVVDDLTHAELVISLPADWGGPGFSFESEDYVPDEITAWPVLLLKCLARFPHSYNTWLGFGHTVREITSPWPFDGPARRAILIGYPLTWPPEFPLMTAGDGAKILFMGVFPLYAEEAAFKLDHGSDSLMDRFEAAGITEILDIRRPNVALYHS